MNTLYYGDCLEVLKALCREYPKGLIDLIYIDPPFNSKRNYNILFQDLIKERNGDKATAMKEAFKDTWSNVTIAQELEELKRLSNLHIYRFLHSNRRIFTDAQMSYLTMMSIRIYYMRELLKETGSFYLHCDPTMSHYLKLLCDMVFGVKHFRNEIVWCYTGPGSPKMKQFNRKHDVIFWYTKTKQWTFNADTVRVPYKDGKLHTGGFKGGKVKITDSKYEDRGKIPETWWHYAIAARGKQYLGYPTQKPEALLERIIQASSNESDLIADFFCGCGTTIAVAQKLNRKWLGCDISHLPIGLIEDKRLKPLKANYHVKGFPNDHAAAQKLAQDKPFEFEQWLVEYVLKGHQTRKTGDGGYDGHIAFQLFHIQKLCLIEVKGGQCGIAQLQRFYKVIQDNQADFGLLICFAKYVTKGMRKYCDEQGVIRESGIVFQLPKLDILTVEAILGDDYPEYLKLYLNNITY